MILMYLIIYILIFFLIAIGVFRFYEMFLLKKDIKLINDRYIKDLIEKGIDENKILKNMGLRYILQISFGIFLLIGVYVLKDNFLNYILPACIIMGIVVKTIEISA